MMIDKVLQNRIADLIVAGKIDTVHATFMELKPGNRVPFPLFKEWLEIVSCTGYLTVDEALSRIRFQDYGKTEMSIINSYQTVAYWLDWNVQGLDALFKSALGRAQHERVSVDAINAQAHMKLTARLFVHRLQNPQRYQQYGNAHLFVIGDSHSLELAGRSLRWNGGDVTVKSMPIRGIKMFHLGAGKPPKFGPYFKSRLKSLPPKPDILLSIGEIDCRPNEGMFVQVHKANNVSLKDVIQSTVAGFVEQVGLALRETGVSPNSITLMGVPQPGYNIAPALPPRTTAPQFLQFIENANMAMRSHALEAGWSFLDIGAATAHKKGVNPADYRVDDFHLSPGFYDNIEEWIVRPSLGR